MAGRGGLQGWSDRGREGWQERAKARVMERQSKGSAVVKNSRRKGTLQLFFDTPFLEMLDAAAYRRGMSIGSYGRRAVAKQIAADLGIPWTDVLRHCARPAPYGSKAPGRAPNGERTVDDGTGYGDW